MKARQSTSNRLIVGSAWAVMVVVSMLPNAVLHEVTGATPVWFRWASFIHFVQDVLIFSFMAAGSITPGD